MSSPHAPLLLSFGVGFSYQLGLEEPPESSKRGQRQAAERRDEEMVVGTAAAGGSGDRRRRTGARVFAQLKKGTGGGGQQQQHCLVSFVVAGVLRAEQRRRARSLPPHAPERPGQLSQSQRSSFSSKPLRPNSNRNSTRTKHAEKQSPPVSFFGRSRWDPHESIHPVEGKVQ